MPEITEQKQKFKKVKLYEIREDRFPSLPRALSYKLRPYARARRLVARLRTMGVDAYAAPTLVNVRRAA